MLGRSLSLCIFTNGFQFPLQSLLSLKRGGECVCMKKKTVSIVLFLIAFIATYLIICFAIPGMRIKLEAEPIEIFFKSITHMVFFKTMISLVVAIIFGAIPLFFGKKK